MSELVFIILKMLKIFRFSFKWKPVCLCEKLGWPAGQWVIDVSVVEKCFKSRENRIEKTTKKDYGKKGRRKKNEWDKNVWPIEPNLHPGFFSQIYSYQKSTAAAASASSAASASAMCNNIYISIASPLRLSGRPVSASKCEWREHLVKLNTKSEWVWECCA